MLKLNTNHIITDLEMMFGDSQSVYESIQNSLRMWRAKIQNRNQFKDQWQEFVKQTRQAIKKTIEIEESFFADFSTINNTSSTQMNEFYQRKINEIIPIVKVTSKLGFSYSETLNDLNFRK